MALLHRRDKIPTTIYEDNYGYTRNSHQPMKDYLDAKRKGENPQYPHLPWSNERALKKYCPSIEVPKYSNSDAINYSKEIFKSAKHRERNSDDTKVINRASSLSVTKSTLSTRLNKHIQIPSLEQKLIRKIQDREDQRRVSRIMDDIEGIKARFNADKDVQLSSSLKKSIRGKTATQITAALLADSAKNMRQSNNEEDYQINCSRHSRGRSESRIVKRTTHIEFVDDRILDQLDQSMSSSLYDVKKQLQNFNQRSEDLYHISRWRKSYFK